MTVNMEILRFIQQKYKYIFSLLNQKKTIRRYINSFIFKYNILLILQYYLFLW